MIRLLLSSVIHDNAIQSNVEAEGLTSLPGVLAFKIQTKIHFRIVEQVSDVRE